MAIELQVESWQRPFERGAPVGLAELLAGYLVTCRWYRDKTRSIDAITIEEIFPILSGDSYLVTVLVRYREGDPQMYLLGVSVAADHPEADVVIARMLAKDGTSGVLYDAFTHSKFTQALLSAIDEQKVFRGLAGDLVALRTNAFENVAGSSPAKLEPRVSKVEQSNTSVIFGDRAILKVFRKLEVGINPDIEIGLFLTERNFQYSPAVAGSIEYRTTNGESSYAAILQRFVKNRGDAWKYTMDSLAAYYRQAQTNSKRPPMLTNTHPMDLASEEISPEASQYIGDYLESSALLGDRTARMHAVLAGGNGDPNFTPEPFTTQERLALYNQLAHHVDIVLQLLRNSKEPEAHTVLASENQIHQRFDPLLHQNITALRIRHHGDFHLGQVLYTGDDFLIIDYEGEPARTLAERRRKNLAMRDVAGMIRSFQYAAYAALPERNSRLASYAAFWTGWVSASFLRSYFRTADGLPFMPASSEERRLLLDVFLLEKALYEVSYELNNRPDWVNIPLRGILSLLT